MRTRIILPFITLLFIGCSKKEEVDPRDQYADFYTVQQSVVTVTNGQSEMTNVPAIRLVVAKDSQSDQLLFADGWASYPVTLNGSSFIIPKFVYKGIIKGVPLTFVGSGSGNFNGKMVEYTYSMADTSKATQITVNAMGAK